MSNTQSNSKALLAILARRRKIGLNDSTHATLLAIGSKKGHSTTSDIANLTGATFNWAVCVPLQDGGMLKRAKQGSNQFDPFHYNITPYGEKVLEYIATGKGDE